MGKRPIPIAFTIKEGGAWYPWQFRAKVFAVSPNTIHAIALADGSELDPINGWREEINDQDALVELLVICGMNFQRDFMPAGSP